MFMYYLRLAALSYRRNPILSTLMVLAVALGVGAYMVVFTLNYFMGGDPIPHKSSQLYHIQFDYGDPTIPNFEPPPTTDLSGHADAARHRTSSSCKLPAQCELKVCGRDRTPRQ